MREYVHYGHTTYDCCMVTKRHNQPISKPDKGLWASPVDTDWGWKDWCESEEFYIEKLEKSFRFTLAENARILQIHTEEDILPYIIKSNYGVRLAITSVTDKLNREKLYEEFDGMELFLSDNYSMRYGIFYSWDCDSIVIWNPDVIRPC